MPIAPLSRGNVVVLGPDRRSALIAYVAGPRHVQRIPRRVITVRERVDGGPQLVREAVDEEAKEVQSDLAAFLWLAGIPAPPATDEWRLHLPAGVTEADLWDAVNGDRVRTQSASNAREVVADVRTALEELLGPLD
ncbi:DUF5956 family protein [Microbacterium sp. NPDC080220]|uniref:DUF5956 family protein n=1 Tax=Microbacterium sp. NPDC080220 TaxID=3161017 RepID=UPI0034454D8B